METQCPECKSLYPISSDHIGRTARCKKCESKFEVQAFDPLESALAQVAETHDTEEDERPPQPASVSQAPRPEKHTVSRGAFIGLAVISLVTIAVLSVVLWTKTSEIDVLRIEKKDLLRRIEDWRTKESLRLKKAGEVERDFDFRQTWWGMSMEEVVAAQGRSPDQSDGRIIQYNEFLLGKSVITSYSFSGRSLVGGSYTITEKYQDPNDYLVVYDGLKVVLTRKYGPPAEVRDEWRDKTWFDDKGKWGRAVSEGHVTFLSVWETERSTISAFLGIEKGEIRCTIGYSGKASTPPDSKTPRQDGENLI